MATALKDKLVTLEDLQQAYSKLKEGIMDTTTGTITISTPSGTSWESQAYHQVVKVGKLVHLIFAGKIKATVSQPSGVIGTVPEGFRPPVATTLPEGGYTINSDGTIYMPTGMSSGTSTTFNMNGFYICA